MFRMLVSSKKINDQCKNITWSLLNIETSKLTMAKWHLANIGNRYTTIWLFSPFRQKSCEFLFCEMNNIWGHKI